MSTSTSERPPFAPDELAAVLGCEEARVEPLPHGPPAATAGLWRVFAGERRAVLKVLRPDPQGHPRWPAAREPEHPYYWRREACAYESGLLERLGGGLRAPHLLASFDRPDGTVALWLEDVRAEPAAAWPLERYGLGARHLGRAQGALAQDPPEEPWLSRRWLRKYLALRAEDIERHLPAGPARAVWEARERILRALERAPRTLGHLDLYAANVFGDARETILVDWAYCGLAALGEDAGNLPVDSLLDGFVPAGQGGDLVRAVWDGYAAGLVESGWAGDLDAVRNVFVTATALKFVWIDVRLEAEAEKAALWRSLMPLLDELREEALRLASSA